MKHSLFLILVIAFTSCSKKEDQETAFSLHLFQEPLHLDPARLRGSSANYFFYNTLRGLYRYDGIKGLVSEGGVCKWKTKLKLTCQIKDQFWSNGEPVTSEDYIRNIHHLIDPKTASPRAHILNNLKNAKQIIKGITRPKELGLTKESSSQFSFYFSQADPEFLYKLTSTALLPIHKSHSFHKKDYKKFISNGPYKVKQWTFGKEMKLEPNPHYKVGHSQRPPVIFYFIDDEMTAYRLYQNKQLSFLRRIPSKVVSQVKDRDDFFITPMARFDYIGFGKNVQALKNLRKALIHAVNYEKLKVLLNSNGKIGCPSLPKGWIDNPPCYDFNLSKAKKYLAKIPPGALTKTYKLKVSQLGGNDIKQQAEFFQNQWKKHLGLIIEISQVEQKVFLSELRKTPPDIFRKGVGLDRPTCLSALETFSNESKQNFIHWSNKEYQAIVDEMSLETNTSSYRKLCRKAVVSLMDEAMIIPLGEMHFSLLASPKFKGWSLNSMNQLDLSQLHKVQDSL